MEGRQGGREGRTERKGMTDLFFVALGNFELDLSLTFFSPFFLPSLPISLPPVLLLRGVRRAVREDASLHHPVSIRQMAARSTFLRRRHGLWYVCSLPPSIPPSFRSFFFPSPSSSFDIAVT